MAKTKEDIINLILEESNSYLDDSLFNISLENDMFVASRKLKLKWHSPIANINEVQKIKRKINKDFKEIEDKKERKRLNEFVINIIGNGLPKNSYFSNADFGFEFKKNKFELTMNGEEFNDTILCLGTDDYYDYFVVSPAFKGVRKVFHDVGEIMDINYNNINDFAQTVFKFGILEGALNKGLINKEDIEGFYPKIKNPKLKELVETFLSSN